VAVVNGQISATPHLLARWRAARPYLGKVRRLAHFANLDLAASLAALAAHAPLPRQLEEQAPSHWSVPTGPESDRLQRNSSRYCGLRLQEDGFGSSDTRAFAQGRQALLLHLLSRARRCKITRTWRVSGQGSYAR